MSELITRENAKQALCECCYMFKYIGDSYTECKYYPCDDIKALEAIPSAEAVQSWIPCSERLPSNDESVLVTIDDRIEFGKYEDGEWSIWDCEHWDKLGSKGIIAWVPLPKPYNGAKKSSDRKKIYIAGPVTGVNGYEETFAKAADALRAKGYEPVNPVAPGIVEGWTYRDYINRGFQMLMECDCMLLLPGYMDSKGAALELHYALAVGMEIMTGGAIK